MTEHTGKYLAYMRVARKATDNSDGVLYQFSWRTGSEALVFISHKHAAEWAAAEGAELMNVPDGQ